MRCCFPHQRVSISNRCGDIDQEMVRHLGVSKAILSNVIFCHQEDSLWPLWESSRLKPIFDDIFAASRFVPTPLVPAPTPAPTRRRPVRRLLRATRRYSAALDQIKEVQKQCAEKLKEADFRLETAKATCDEARSVCHSAHVARPPPFPAPAPDHANVGRCLGRVQRRNQATELHARIQSSEGDRQTIQAQVARAEDTIRRLNEELASIDAVRRGPISALRRGRSRAHRQH